MPSLKNWRDKGMRLVGHIYNDERFPDGMLVITSDVTLIQKMPSGEGVIATTKSGTRYELLTADKRSD